GTGTRRRRRGAASHTTTISRAGCRAGSAAKPGTNGGRMGHRTSTVLLSLVALREELHQRRVHPRIDLVVIEADHLVKALLRRSHGGVEALALAERNQPVGSAVGDEHRTRTAAD